MTRQWSPYVVERVARGLLATLRDFGVLEGAANKRLASIYLSFEAFAFVALYLKRQQASGKRLISHPDWNLFFLVPQAVEHYFVEAHQRHLLEYHAAGSVIRISFPTYSIEEYAHVVAQRAH